MNKTIVYETLIIIIRQGHENTIINKTLRLTQKRIMKNIKTPIMHKYVHFNNLLFLFLFLASCTSSKTLSSSFWDQCDMIAHWEVIDGDSVIVCDADKAVKEMDVPLDLIAEDLQVIKLDNKAKIDRKSYHAYITDNYIGLSLYNYYPLKLFKRDGTFLRNIGSMGKAADEYTCISDLQIDEKNNRIYILPGDVSDDKRIAVFDLDGNYLQNIPLADKAFFGSTIKVYPEKGQIVLAAPIRPKFPQLCIWTQDLEGNLVQGIPSGKHATYEYSSTLVLSRCHTKQVEVFNINFINNHEYLYHYDRTGGRLIPKFHINTAATGISIYELPSCYIVEELGPTGGTDAVTDKFIVDKKTLRGCKFKGFITPYGLSLNQYCMLFQCHNGYFSLIEDGSIISKRIQTINMNKLTEQQCNHLHKLQQMISKEKEDCHLLFMTKFK